MSEQTQLDQLLKFLLETLQQGKDFSVEQAPLFVQELLMWCYYEAVFFACLGLVLFAAGWVVFLILRRNGSDDGFEFLPAGAGTIVGVAMVASNIYTAIQVTVAPRLVLVQMVREMLR